MRIISWNTNGLRATIKCETFWPLFKKYKADIVALQETKSERDQIPKEYLAFSDFESVFESAKTRKGYSGVAIYSNRKSKTKKVPGALGKDMEGRILLQEYEKFFFINCYFPNGGGAPERLEYKLYFYDEMLKLMKKLEKQKPVILCGDVNVAHEELDIARPKENEKHVGFLPEERAWIDEVLRAGFIDVFRHMYPKKVEYTWWDQKTRARDRDIGWRIDYFLISPKLIKKVKNISQLTKYLGSDHCPIVLDIEI